MAKSTSGKLELKEHFNLLHRSFYDTAFKRNNKSQKNIIIAFCSSFPLVGACVLVIKGAGCNISYIICYYSLEKRTQIHKLPNYTALAKQRAECLLDNFHLFYLTNYMILLY